MTTTAARALVLGGGVAGLCAAFGLARRGFRVSLLESRGWLGGRAFSSMDRVHGVPLDNGPHVLLGCYRATRALLRTLGTEDLLHRDRSLALAYRNRSGARARLALSRLPAPLAMPAALLRLPLLRGARVRALLGMGSVLRGAPADRTLADWLRARRQLGAPDELLWRPLCRAIMNVEPEVASARAFLATLRIAFAGSAANAAFLVPARPWGEVLGDAAERALAATGIELRLHARVRALATAGGRVDAVVLADGERLALEDGDVVVSALPWHALRAVWPALPAPYGELASAAIVSAFVATPSDAPPLPDDGPVTVLAGGTPFHFLMRTPGGDPRRVALLAAGDGAFPGLAAADIGALALQQLRELFPAAALANASVRVRKERDATFVASCGSERARPAPGPLPGGPDNLYVCGDWTATGLPATLEGAARSADAMLATVGGPARRGY
jgi:squalene-associated FAD-dependent desaturase